MCPISFLLFCASVAAHRCGHFLNALQWERRPAQRLYGNVHELHGVIIRRHAVGVERAATPATMNDRPLAALAHPNGNRLHNAAAVAFPVTRLYVHMDAGNGKAVGQSNAMRSLFS